MNSFYLRLIKRQWRLPAIKLFCIAVALASAVTFSITLLSDRLEQLFQQQSKEVLAADILLRSSSALTDEQFDLIANVDSLQKAETVSFQSMAAANGEFVLSSVKAVSAEYPLKGQLQIAPELYGEVEAKASGPEQGKVWVEDRVLNELGLSIGDALTVGELELGIEAVLVFEPDRGSSFYSFTPRVLMHLADLEATQVIQPGSRATFDYLFAGADSSLSALEQSIDSTLQPNQEFVSIESANQTLADTLDRAYRFLSITALIAVLLGAVAVALVSYHYAAEMTYQYAVLRCLGLKSWALRKAIALPFVSFTVLGIALGLMIGGGVHLIILNSLGELIPADLPQASYRPYLYSIATAGLIVLSFAWPFLNRLMKTSPKSLLSEQHSVASGKVKWIALSLGLGLTALVQINTGNIALSLLLISALAVTVGIAYGLSQLAIRWFRNYAQHRSVHLRLGARILHANRTMAALQVIAIAMTFFSLALVQTLRDDLLESWQSSVPDDAPNFFAINLYQDELADFNQALEKLDVPSSPLYPIVRGRLTEINSEPVRTAVTKESQAGRASNRDLSLTWADQVPADNEVTAGQWHDALDADSLKPDTVSVSVETELAESMGIGVGDHLQFVIAARTLEATVTSLRTVKWESFTPNFYMMFDDQALADFPATYISSFHLNQEQRKHVPELVEEFPSATFFDVDFLLKRIQGIIAQVSFAIESILYFALAASLVVFVAIEMILHHSRLYTAAVCKAMGARVALVQRVYRLQFWLIGGLAGLMAYGVNVLAAFLLSRYALESEFVFNPKTLVLCLLVAPILVYAAGQISIRRTRSVPAKTLLNES